jgi:hypothetical protein
MQVRDAAHPNRFSTSDHGFTVRHEMCRMRRFITRHAGSPLRGAQTSRSTKKTVRSPLNAANAYLGEPDRAPLADPGDGP